MSVVDNKAAQRWRETVDPYCMLCGDDPWPGLQVHHILPRSTFRYDVPDNFLLACQFCHDDIERREIGIVDQLRAKIEHDPQCREHTKFLLGLVQRAMSEVTVGSRIDPAHDPTAADYESVPDEEAGTVRVRYEDAGELEPMPYDESGRVS